MSTLCITIAELSTRRKFRTHRYPLPLVRRCPALVALLRHIIFHGISLIIIFSISNYAFTIQRLNLAIIQICAGLHEKKSYELWDIDPSKNAFSIPPLMHPLSHPREKKRGRGMIIPWKYQARRIQRHKLDYSFKISWVLVTTEFNGIRTLESRSSVCSYVARRCVVRTKNLVRD